MCGIVGVISKREVVTLEKEVLASLKVTKHRGPDHTGYMKFKKFGWNVFLGMNRLSILDISSRANQPMKYKNHTIVFNGEIYNYIEIREELQKKGHLFKTNSDTEVVLHAWDEWGIESIGKMNGMFSISIFDENKYTMYLIRDRFGEKPLYYYYDGEEFWFSSELKGIIVNKKKFLSFDVNSIYNFFVFNSVPTPYTIFNEVRQVPPGEYMIVRFNNEKLEISSFEYWKLPEIREPRDIIDEKKVLNELEELIYNAIKIRLRSDVPLGIFLSGGIDSALISAVASEIHPNIRAFTIGYKDKNHDESERAKFFAKSLRIDHEIIYLNEDDINKTFYEFSYISDDLLANMTLIPVYYLSSVVREHVKVALSGDGGDEFFCGYVNYKYIYYIYLFRKLLKVLKPLSIFNNKIETVVNIAESGSNMDIILATYRVRLKLKNVSNLFKEEFRKDLRIKKLYSIFKTLSSDLKNANHFFWQINYYEGGGNYLTDTVLKTTDRASMYNSLEVRPIFTDFRFSEFVAKLPYTLLLKNGVDKYLLRKILSKYINEKELVFKLPKKGFSVPMTTDYKRKFEKELKKVSLLKNKVNLYFLDLKELKNILEIKKPNFVNLQMRLIFLINFLHNWGFYA